MRYRNQRQQDRRSLIVAIIILLTLCGYAVHLVQEVL